MSRLKKYLRNGLTIALFSVIAFISSSQAQTVKHQAIKYQNLLALIDAFYVDTVNLEKLTEDAVIKVLADLDPHSVYISKDEIKEMNEPLQGSFSGIGIQFNILRDTLMVVGTVPGGPSEKVGVRAGDRIVKIDDENVAAVGLKNTGVFKKLRGEKGTLVTILVKRKGEKELLEFMITRDKIPIYSRDAAYMITKDIGYIKFNRFSVSTSKEFDEALQKLKAKKMKNLILDLRGNGGGVMGAAIKMVDHFLSENKMIVYTKGLRMPKAEFKSTAKGDFEEGKVVVLIDEGSASASEIVSGAVQDWDRGVIVGRRSFGKGLVQRQFPLSDGTLVRLTTAHYHTPTGRCIQRSYEKGLKDYYLEVYKRYETGEMANADSIHFPDSLKYSTLVNKRTVYGGGGIMPDIYIPIDTAANYKYFNLLARKNVINPYVLDYIDHHREQLKKDYPSFEVFNRKFETSEKMLAEIVALGDKKKIKKTEEEYKAVKDDIKKHIKALIARDLWETDEFYKVLNADNKYILKAIELLESPKKYKEALSQKK
jgi:carboxyl-terminal processing protease